MKHLLNDMSFEERQNIREQHEGGMSIDTSKFRKLMESKLGNVKPLITEAVTKGFKKLGTWVAVTGAGKIEAILPTLFT